MPLISILMPVLNAGKWIFQSTNSILQQSFTDFELIVIDDGCTDESVSIIENFKSKKIKIIRNKQKGISNALRLGVKFSDSMYLARQDADDISDCKRLEVQVNFLKDHKDVCVLGSNAYLIDEKNKRIGKTNLPLSDEAIRLRLNISSPFVHPTVLMRRKTVIEAGNYQNQIAGPYPEDFDLFSRVQKLGALRNIGNKMYFYRVLKNSESNKNFDSIYGQAAIIASHSISANFRIKSDQKSIENMMLQFYGVKEIKEVKSMLKIIFLLLSIRIRNAKKIIRKGIPITFYLVPIYRRYIQKKRA